MKQEDIDNERAVRILIECELYRFIQAANENLSKEKAKEMIENYTKDFKESVLKIYKVENIDKLIKETIYEMEKNKKDIRNNDDER